MASSHAASGSGRVRASRRRVPQLLAFVVVVTVMSLSAGIGVAHENISSDWNWWDFGSYNACGKGSTHAPGYSQASGRGWSWVTSGANCDSTKVSAVQEVQNDLGYISNGSWKSCDKAEADWSWTTVRVTTTYNGPCSGGHTFYTLSTMGACIVGVCKNSGPICNDPNPPEFTCEPLDLYPLVSPGHYWS